jgi:thioredoxin-related protein
MRNALFAFLAGSALLAFTAAADSTWLTDVAKAQAQAKAENKLVLLDFTGSDWCRWCVKLKKEVFSTPEFTEYAQKNLVLVEVDFPKHKAIPEAEKSAHKALAQKYGVRGFPTIILLDGAGKQVAQLGFDDGLENKNEQDPDKMVAKPGPFLAALEKAKKK